MVTKTFEGSIDSYQGKALDTPRNFSGEVEVPEGIAEAKEKGFWPNESEILKGIQNKLVTAAKASAYQKETADLKEKYENSADFKRAQFIKAALAMGMNKTQAEALADSNLG
jgi:hypothetical protein